MNKELESKAKRMYKLLQEQENNQAQGWIAMTVSQSTDIRQLLVEFAKIVGHQEEVIQDLKESINYNVV